LQCHDKTFVSQGLFPHISSYEEILREFQYGYGNSTCTLCRQYGQNVSDQGLVSYHEKVDEGVDIRFSDYLLYLHNYQEAIGSPNGNQNPFTYRDSKGKETKLDDVSEKVFYAYDMDMTQRVPKLLAQFSDNFRLREALPGGEWCMSREVMYTGCLLVKKRLDNT